MKTHRNQIKNSDKHINQRKNKQNTQTNT